MAWSPWLGCFCASLSVPWKLVLPILGPRRTHPTALRLPPQAPFLTPSQGEPQELCSGKGLAHTFLMWTLSGSDLEKKRRVVYRNNDPRRNSSMPVPSKAAVIT